MRVQVLASVMEEEIGALVRRMRLSSDAVIINQCGKLGYEEERHGNHLIRFYSFPDRGVGRGSGV